MDVCQKIELRLLNKVWLLTNLSASHTLELISELTLEKVDDDTIVTHPVYLPLLLTCYLLWQNFQFRFSFRRDFVVWLLQNAIEVFVQTI